MNKPICITAGDVSGIGPEVLAKSFQNKHIKYSKHPFLIIGPESIITGELSKNSNINISKIRAITDMANYDNSVKITILDQTNNELMNIPKGELSTTAGKWAYNFVNTAADLALSNRCSAIVTAPINKEAWDKAGIKEKGHTGFLAKKGDVSNYAMAFYSEDLKVILATIHIPLSKISTELSTDGIVNKIVLANNFLKQLSIQDPVIGVCGLNPHAGEDGLLGDEENTIIKPAIKIAQSLGINAKGPYPADTIFYSAYHKKNIDMIVSMYHDQGLAPLKLIHFHDAVNITLGLPFIRTSPDHGTAFDIANDNIANPDSMTNAILLAMRLIDQNG